MKEVSILMELTNFKLIKNSNGNPQLNIEIDKEHFNTVYDALLDLSLSIDEIESNKITVKEYEELNLFE